MDYFKDFDQWNRFKKILENIRITLISQEGEIWNAAIGVNLGTEIDGKGNDFQRPVLIIRRFSNEQSWIIPISSRKKSLIPHLQLPIDHASLHKDSIVILNQLTLLSNKRLLARIGRLNLRKFKAIIQALIQLFPK